MVVAMTSAAPLGAAATVVTRSPGRSDTTAGAPAVVSPRSERVTLSW
jgi:hypothetical protein